MNKRGRKKAAKKELMERENIVARLGDLPLPHKRLPRLSSRERKAIEREKSPTKGGES